MSESSLTPDVPRKPPAGQLQALDAVCDRFEHAWKAGHRPVIEEYLRDAEGLDHSPFLFELLHVEVYQRRQRSEQPTAEEYLQRFPQYGEAIQAVFAAAPVIAGNALAPVQDLVRTGEQGDTLPDIPGYEVLTLLGQGGMGVVYKARQVRLNRLVAVKMIRARICGDGEGLTRFQMEAEAVARLQHPNIVQIYEIGDVAAQPFIALEFAEGGSLDQRLAALPMLSQEAARLIETLARAVHAAHEHGIVHRDLKPANVLLGQRHFLR